MTACPPGAGAAGGDADALVRPARALLDAVGPAVVDLVEGWATVELERARAVVSAAGGLAAAAPGDELLGARCAIARLPGGGRRVLLEPSTEGRLAATLARHGEGLAALYVLVEADLEAPIPGQRLSPAGGGPLGPQRRLLGGSRFGPHVLLVTAAGPDEPGYHRPMLEPASVALRPATTDDAERIAALLTDEGYPAGPSDIVERLERFGSDFSRVVVADLDGEVLGFVAIHALPRFEHGDRIVRVLALVVDPGARERGVGHQLMEEAEAAGREVGAAFIEVTAGHHRAEARRLYESLGYDSTVTTYLRKRL